MVDYPASKPRQPGFVRLHRFDLMEGGSGSTSPATTEITAAAATSRVRHSTETKVRSFGFRSVPALKQHDIGIGNEEGFRPGL
ncbi:hypothetical protein EJB05_46436, partial [Eragrostis curvula]